MSIQRRKWRVRWKWRVIVATVVALSVGVALASALGNRLSSAKIVGRWQGYRLQRMGAARRATFTRVPLALTFRADGVVTRPNATDGAYLFCDDALVIYSIRSGTGPSHPFLWNARIVGDTLTISGSKPVAVLRRVQ